jgi:predicted thioesterase
MVGLVEWTCIQAVNPHLDWPREQTVGIGVNLTHSAATPPGLPVTIHVRLEKVERRKLTFSVSAEDGVDQISTGTHERFVIDAETFNNRVSDKLERCRTGQTENSPRRTTRIHGLVSRGSRVGFRGPPLWAYRIGIRSRK